MSVNEHSILVNQILLAVGQMEFVRVWKNSTGVAEIDGRMVAYGLPGSADITGILTNARNLGLRLEIEVKTGNAVQSKKQKAFEKMILDRGGLYLLARSVDDAIKFVVEKRGSI